MTDPLRPSPDLDELPVYDAEGVPVGSTFGVLSEADTGLVRYFDISLEERRRHVLVPVGHARLEQHLGRLRIRLINLGINPLKKGDVFVTSGAGGYYHPGIAVAILQEVTEDGGVAAVISDPAATDYVAVEPIWQPEAVKAAQTPVEEVVPE